MTTLEDTTLPGPLALGSSEGLGPLATERAAFEAWLNPGQHPGNVSAWVEPGRYENDRHQMAWLGWRAAKRTQTVPAGWVLMPEEVTGEEAMYAQAALMDRSWCAVTCFVARYEALIRATRQRRDALTSGPNVF